MWRWIIGWRREWSPVLKQRFVLCECAGWARADWSCVKILISLKCQKFPKKLSQKRKWLFPKSQKPHQPKVHVISTLQQGTLSWSPLSLSVKVCVIFLIMSTYKSVSGNLEFTEYFNKHHHFFKNLKI